MPTESKVTLYRVIEQWGGNPVLAQTEATEGPKAFHFTTGTEVTDFCKLLTRERAGRLGLRETKVEAVRYYREQCQERLRRVERFLDEERSKVKAAIALEKAVEDAD